MSLPASVDWTPRYTAVLTQRIWGDPAGDCFPASVVYAMEMRNILQGGVPVQLSELDLNFRGAYDAVNGVCREDLWPVSNLSPTPEIPDPYQAMLAGARRPPSAAAVADRVNQKLVVDGGGMFFPTNFFSRQAFVDGCQALIAAGYPICIFWPPNHEVCAWGYDRTGFIGFDNRATSPGIYHLDYDQTCGPTGGSVYVVKRVVFSGGAAPIITPPVPIVPPITGNTQMLTDIITLAQTALAAGGPTQAQKDTLAANVAALVPIAVAPPVTPPVVPPVAPPAGTSAAGTTVTPGAGSITDNTGVVWKIDAWSSVRRNGADAGGFWASRAIWTGARVEATNKDNGSVSFWNGNGWTWTGR